MLKKQLSSFLLLLVSLTGFSQEVKYPYYYQAVNNATNTINFIFGLYPATAHYDEGKDFDAYTSIRAAIFNKSPKDSLKWNNFKVNILLKSGQLICNYVPFSKKAPFGCTYTVSADSTHYQTYCFHTKFTKEEIDRAWLLMSEDEIFSLTYDKNE